MTLKRVRLLSVLESPDYGREWLEANGYGTKAGKSADLADTSATIVVVVFDSHLNH